LNLQISLYSAEHVLDYLSYGERSSVLFHYFVETIPHLSGGRIFQQFICGEAGTDSLRVFLSGQREKKSCRQEWMITLPSSFYLEKSLEGDPVKGHETFIGIVAHL
jgi:hypothetical protein